MEPVKDEEKETSEEIAEDGLGFTRCGSTCESEDIFPDPSDV